MNQLKKIAIWIFVAAMVSAISTGCATGPETKSSSDKNRESTDKTLEESGYY
jgi:hypothetical protein